MKKQMESLSLRWEKEVKPFSPAVCPPPVQNHVTQDMFISKEECQEFHKMELSGF